MKKTGEQINQGYKVVAASTMVGVQKMNSAIDANPTLKNAKEQTAKSLSYVSSSMSGWFGWGSKKKADIPKEEPQEEVKEEVVVDVPVAE